MFPFPLRTLTLVIRVAGQTTGTAATSAARRVDPVGHQSLHFRRRCPATHPNLKTRMVTVATRPRSHSPCTLITCRWSPRRRWVTRSWCTSSSRSTLRYSPQQTPTDRRARCPAWWDRLPPWRPSNLWPISWTTCRRWCHHCPTLRTSCRSIWEHEMQVGNRAA